MRTAALLAAVTLASVACRDELQPTVGGTLADSADQIILGARTHVTEEGIRRALVEADTAFVFDARQQAELRGVHTTFYGPQGVEHSVLTAREATYEMRTGNMEARGDVVVVASDGRRLLTEVLRYDQTTAKISSDRRTRFIDRDTELVGESFVSNPDFTDIQIVSARGPAGRVTLPNR